VQAVDLDRSELIQTAYFRPTPFWGHLYWYLLYPIHWFIFRGMAKRIVKLAEAHVQGAGAQPVAGKIG
jgi:hypothetical protein